MFGRPSASLLMRIVCTPCLSRAVVRAGGGDKRRNLQSSSVLAIGTIAFLSASRTEMKTVPSVGSTVPAAIWLLAKAMGKSLVDAHDFAGAAHLRAEDDIDAGEFAEGEDDFLHATYALGRAVRCTPSSSSVLPAMTLAAILAQGMPVALETNGTVRRGAGVDFDDVDLVVLDRVLHVHQAADAQGLGERAGLLFQLCDDFLRQRVGRQRAGGVAGVNAGFFDVLHDAAR